MTGNMIIIFWRGVKKLFESGELKLKKATKSPIKPQFINFIATYKCNSRCTMCDIWKKYLKDEQLAQKELSRDEIKTFFESNREYLNEIKSVGITGGDAFLREDIVGIVEDLHITIPHSAIGIQTNGLLPEMICGKIEAIKKFYDGFGLAVSLDGIGETHDKVRGVKGAYQQALKTIEGAKKLGVSSITTGMTVSSLNYRQIHEVKEVSESMGCEFSCFLADTSDYFDNVDSNNYKLSEYQIKEVVECLKEFQHHYYMDNLRLQLEHKRKRNVPCYSGYTSIVIDPYGNVKPCILSPEVFGNIREISLYEIVNSDKAWEIRRKLTGCTCWSQCEVSSSAIVAPLDVVLWWVFRCNNKKGFLKSINKKNFFART